MLKRNDKCHCGSGKKYKKCCMDKDSINKRKEREIAILEDKKNAADKKYTDSVLKLGEHLEKLIDENEVFSKLEESTRDLFFDDMVVRNIAANRFFASYFSYDCYIDDNFTPASYVLNNNKFTKDEYSVIENCIKSYPSLFEIIDINGIKVTIKDVFTKIEYNTLDSKILDGFVVGDFILARPVKINDIFVLIDLTIRIQNDMVDVIKNTLMDAYNQNIDKVPNIEYLVAINSLFFYKYMLQLLQMSDYKDEALEESLNEIEEDELDDKVNDGELDIKCVLENTIEDIEVLNNSIEILNKVSHGINSKGYENGWAAGIVYYCRKSAGENVTQSSIAKLFGVSVSTLAKRSKEVGTILSEI